MPDVASSVRRLVRRLARRRVLGLIGGAALGAGLVATPVGAAAESASAPVPVPTAAPATVLPEDPVEYAEATFDAWVARDANMLQRLTNPFVAKLLTDRQPPEPTLRPQPACEGAAGLTYCTFYLPDDNQLLLRVNNEAASVGDPHAVGGADFITSPWGVAIWPLTTHVQAWNTQHSVDNGSSPWMLDPATVLTFYAESVLGYADPIVEEGDVEVPWPITDQATGFTVGAEVVQPARSGDTGIWAVKKVGV